MSIVQKSLVIASIGSVLLLLSCSSTTLKATRGQPAINDLQATVRNSIADDQRLSDKTNQMKVPPNVSNALLSNSPTGSASEAVASSDEERFNLSVRDESAQAFFIGLVKGTKYNIIVSPAIKGTISLDLKNVTIPEVLEAVRDAYSYDFDRTPYGFRVFPADFQVRIFNVNYLDMVRKGQSDTLISSGEVTGNTTQGAATTSATGETSSSSTSQSSTNSSAVSTRTNEDFWKDLRTTLVAIVGNKDGRKIVINPNSGTIVVRAYPSELRTVAQYLDTMQSAMDREVILDAKVLEVTLTNGYQSGVDWNALGFVQTSGNTFKLPDGQTFVDPFTPISSWTTDPSGKHIINIIQLLSMQGNVQVLSSPRISTMNNQKAVIKVGSDSFFITNVSSSTTATTSTTQTQNITLTPFFSGVALDVTPQIAADNQVILHIHPMISAVTDQTRTFTVSGTVQSLPLAHSVIRESDSIVRARNGQVIIIGGLMQNETREQVAKTPFIGSVPFIGSLFRRTQQQAVKSELVILLRATVINDNVWPQRLRTVNERFRSLDRGYHLNDQMNTFGNLGETEDIR